MKVKGFEKVIILHLGALFGAANAGEKSVKSFHRTLLNTPNMDEISVHEFAAGRVSDLLAKHEVKDPIGYKTIGFAPYADYVGGKFAMGIPALTPSCCRPKSVNACCPASACATK